MPSEATYNDKAGCIKTIADLLCFAKSLSTKCRPGGVYFRGQANSCWGLRPSIGRCHSYAKKSLPYFNATQERDLLHRFRRYSYSYLNRVLSDWEALFLARHHFLPVRLLDWSYNPLVALFAACCESEHILKDGTVWAIRRVSNDEHDLNLFTTKQSPFSVWAVKLLYPFYGSSRITAQSGLFTIQDNPWQNLEDYFPYKLPSEYFDIEALNRFVVPARAKPHCIEELERCGINARTMYPDLDGLARALWQTEVLRRGCCCESAV